MEQPEKVQQAKKVQQVKKAQEERRAGPADRRRTQPDRRNAERVSEDVAPRRHPDVKDRRSRT